MVYGFVFHETGRPPGASCVRNVLLLRGEKRALEICKLKDGGLDGKRRAGGCPCRSRSLIVLKNFDEPSRGEETVFGVFGSLLNLVDIKTGFSQHSDDGFSLRCESFYSSTSKEAAREVSCICARLWNLAAMV